MRNIIKFTVVLLAAATLTFMGCSGKGLAPVSGKVTFDGEPVAGITVVFQPRAEEGSAIQGPWSSGLTNAQGEYSLVTRHGKRGAMIAVHDVSFSYDDAKNLGELRADLDDAREGGDKEEFESIKKEIAEEIIAAKGRFPISDELSMEFTVPSGGSTEANIELSKEKSD